MNPYGYCGRANKVNVEQKDEAEPEESQPTSETTTHADVSPTHLVVASTNAGITLTHVDITLTNADSIRHQGQGENHYDEDRMITLLECMTDVCV